VGNLLRIAPQFSRAQEANYGLGVNLHAMRVRRSFPAAASVGCSVACLEWQGWDSRFNPPASMAREHSGLCCLKPLLQKRLEGKGSAEENS